MQEMQICAQLSQNVDVKEITKNLMNSLKEDLKSPSNYSIPTTFMLPYFMVA